MLASEAFLRSAAEMWMRWMMAMSWQVSVLVAVVFVVSLVARKASARFRYALWCLVLLKLCLPPTFSLVTGIGRWLPAISADRAKTAIESVTVSEMPAPISPVALPRGDELVTSPPLELPPASTGVLSPPALPPQQFTRMYLSRPSLLFAVWLVGVLFFVLILGRQYRKMRRYLLTARPVRDERTLRLIDEAKASLRVKTPVRFFESPRLFSPILLGIFRPNIVLPAGTLKGAENRQILPVFLHELAHFKRRDLWANWVQVVLQILYWFHPLVWIANLYIRREREMIVDDMVLVHLKGEREAYGDSLVSILKQAARKRLLAPGYVGIVETKKSLAYRLRRILDANRKLSVRLGWLSAAALIAFALILIPQAGAVKAASELGEIAESVETTEKEFSSSPVVAEAEHIPPHDYALSFDGVDDFLEVPDTEILDVGDEFTVEVWVKVREAVGERAILSKEVPWKSGYTLIVEGLQARASIYSKGVYVVEKGDFCNLTFGIGNGVEFQNLTVPGILEKGKWAHVAAVWNKGQVSLMLNGKIVGRSMFPKFAKAAPARVPLMIGKGSADLGRYFNGEIGELRIWNVARSQSEIRSYIGQALTGKEAGLVASWTFGESSGQVAHDISANGNHARLGSSSDADDADPKWLQLVQEQTPGQATEKAPEWVVLDFPVAGTKCALQFDGLTDFVEVPDSPSLDLTNSLTVEAWINFDVGGDNNPRIISKGWEVRTGYELAVYGTGEKRRLAFLAKEIGRTYSNTILRAHTWYHVAATYNGTEVTLYVNGKQDILRNVSGGDVPFNIPTNNINLNIGRNSQNFTDRYKGLIKEVRVWSVARTEDEIRRDMSRVLTGMESNLSAYWKLDEGEGVICRDASPNHNDGRFGI